MKSLELPPPEDLQPAHGGTANEGSTVDEYLHQGREARLASLMQLLEIPSVSSAPERARDCRHAAERVAADMLRAGLESVEVSETGGHPVVYGEWLRAPGAPTVLVYGHYDVVPAGPREQWQTDPFEPAIGDGRIVARGAADDKSQVVMHLAAVEALLATAGRLPLNLRMIVEGEEEISSVHLEPWLHANSRRLVADVAVISDTTFAEGNIPALTVSLRGIVCLQLDVVSAASELHSGLYGGAVPNAASALAQVVASLKDADGRVTAPGFYDDVVQLSTFEQLMMERANFGAASYQASIGVRELVGEAGYSTLERIGARPSLDVNGMWSGYEGAGIKTIIPAKAQAKISCRLVPNQDPHRVFDLLRSYIGSIAPSAVEVSLRCLGTARPFSASVDDGASRAAARALLAAFGTEPAHVRFGGSIPAAASFRDLLGLPVILLGFAPPNGNFHAPNEWMDLGNVEAGIRAIVRYWHELAAGLTD